MGDAILSEGHGIEVRVVDESMAGEQRVSRERDRRVGSAGVDQPGGSDDLHTAGGRIEDEVAIGVGGEQGNIADVIVGQDDAELRGVGLDVRPGCHARVVVGRAQQAIRALGMLEELAA